MRPDALDCNIFGGPILAIGYIGIATVTLQLPFFRTVFRPISKAGRMSLTTYITQSIVATLFFMLMVSACMEKSIWRREHGLLLVYSPSKLSSRSSGYRSSGWVHLNGYGEKGRTEKI